MPIWQDTQRLHLTEKITGYAQDSCFLSADEEIPNAITSVLENGDCTVEFTGDRTVSVLITADPTQILVDVGHAVFPCGANLPGLIKKVARAVVHEIYDPIEM